MNGTGTSAGNATGRWLAALTLLLGAAVTLAQPALPPSAGPAIERALAGLERAGLDEASLRDAQAALEAATAFDARADQAVEAMRGLREAVAAARRERANLLAALEADAAQGFRRWRTALPTDADVERLEALLAGERAEVAQLRAALAQVRETLASMVGDSLATVERNAELQLQIDALQRRLATPATEADGEPPALAQSRQLQAQAELRASTAELARRQLEQETTPTRREHLELRQRQLLRDLGDHEQRVVVLQTLIAERLGDQLAELTARLAGQAEAFADADAEPLLQRAAEDNLALGRELASTTAALNRLRDESQSLAQERERIANALRNTRTRLALEGQDEALGLLLLSERRRLAAPDVLARRLGDVRSALAAARLRQLALTDQRSALADPETVVGDMIAQAEVEIEDSDRIAELRGTLYRLLGEREELLPPLDATLQRYVTALEQAEAALHGQLADTRAMRDLLDARLFWIRSHASVDASWPSRQAAGWFDLLKPSRFATSARLLGARAAESPLRPVLVLALAATLLWLRRRASRLNQALAPPLRRPGEDDYPRTLKTLLVALGAAMPFALLLWGLGSELRAAGEPGRYSDSLGRACIAVAGSLFLLEFLRWLVIEKGLAHLHFRWTRPRRDSLARTLPWLIGLLLPLQFLIVLAFARRQELAIETAGRVALVAFCVIGAVALWRLLAPDRLWSSRGGGPEPHRLRQLLRLALPGLLLALAGVILAGYVYSGLVVSLALWGTLWAVAGVAVVHGLLARWFLLGERRLTYKRWLARREAARQESPQATSDEGIHEVDAEPLAAETVNAQTARLLRAFTLTLWVSALLWVWADVLPALARLDEVQLWSFSDTEADGGATVGFVTLKAVLFGALVLVLTVVAARNLPGLLELGVLGRLALDAPTRYAITTLSRYAIVIVGVVIGFGLLGLRWSQLQWMAAALSVGLGFGLQEIFANFVSGLILLSERPFRVGDVITIGDQTGTVSRISTRATTLVDFDNREVVVPNKTFITERLVNWTLSDTRTRLILKVGVAYGSDVAKVHQLLLQAAAEEPLVLKDPPPRSWFMAFGASSLDFELRVFVDSVLNRWPASSQLNGRIDALFREHGVEIAFPQLDLHVRDGVAALAVAPQDRGDAAEGGTLRDTP